MRDRSVSLFWTLHFGGWFILYIALVVAVLTEQALGYALAHKAVTVVLGLLITTGLWPIYRHLFRRGTAPWLVLAVSIAASYVGAYFWDLGFVLTYNAALAPLFGEEAWALGKISFFRAIYNAPYLLAWSLLYFGIKYYQALIEERERSLRAQAEAHQARLRALRYQLNPHFLFNTMNAISTLIVEERNREATRMIAQLSDFLRMTLEGSGEAQVPLAEEIEFTRRYLEIEQIRLGDRLRVHFEVDDDALPLPVPAMILQPLVENAIKHAISPSEEGGWIRIEARRTGPWLLLRIMDSGAGFDRSHAASSDGIGLANTRERLQQLYGDRQRFELSKSRDGGLSVSIQLPLGSPEFAPLSTVAR